MEIKILYNNIAKKDFKAGHGFSALISNQNTNLLFDVGWDPKTLIHNLKKLDHKTKDIKNIFLSHQHWDHIGALPQILRKNTKVYVPSSFSIKLKKELKRRAKLVEVKKTNKITQNIYSTGEIGGKLTEQSLVINKEKTTLITGCGHPGIRKIKQKAKKIEDIDIIIGGLHNFKNYNEIENLSKFYPLHCTQNIKEIKNSFPNKTYQIKAGSKINI